jgi:putative hydrolase of the HAD superfamily
VAIKAVAFDIDGTLYPDLALRLRVIPFGLRNLGFLLAHAKARGELHRRAASGLRGEGHGRDLASFRELQAELTAARLGSSAEKAKALAEASVYGELESSFSRVPLYAGVVDCLESFRGAGLRLAVLSDFPAARKLGILGIAGYFEAARSSEESGLLKPAPEPFLALAAELGLEPGEILYVGNSPRYDVAGARAAGMRSALRVSRLSALLGKASRLEAGMRPDFAFSSWAKLRDFVLGSLEP